MQCPPPTDLSSSCTDRLICLPTRPPTRQPSHRPTRPPMPDGQSQPGTTAGFSWVGGMSLAPLSLPNPIQRKRNAHTKCEMRAASRELQRKMRTAKCQMHNAQCTSPFSKPFPLGFRILRSGLGCRFGFSPIRLNFFSSSRACRCENDGGEESRVGVTFGPCPTMRKSRHLWIGGFYHLKRESSSRR